MKIYFCGSIRGGRQDADLYMRIINQLKTYGKVLTEHVGDLSFKENPSEKHIHDRDCDWLQESDVVVAEVTQTSLGVGYEIGRAVAMNKKILCLYRPTEGKSLSAMIRGADNGKTFLVKDYAEKDVPQLLKEFLES
ncbi:putative 2'-deoxynucleoside 5'-phosphate N-hydrolase 1 [Apostichopus japonicus]|uniref:Putative 2'-deoxynucleoside 5'-phosphate N-hydrolase 1 n=1 Tax=Stichopus japonicus TaxID=307972 RepID=A0A2G8LIY2_STIJA|nr:putative 2'-deoxynucleoside 5'-phosphate N-hydrolase 1 [Apostichopus japonicus]